MNNREAGRIELILGPAFAGKTSELLRRIRRFGICKQKCLVVRHKASGNDRQDIEKAYSTLQHGSTVMMCSSLSEISGLWSNYHVIAIDDGHLFADIQSCEAMAENNRIVIVSSMDGDCNQRPYHSILNLVAQCESLDKLSAICIQCGKEAAFTKKSAHPQTYEPSCRECLFL